MKKYRVIEAPRAKKDIKRYVGYLRNVKKSNQAAQALFDDYTMMYAPLSPATIPRSVMSPW